jgi:hypothetical protein
MSFHSSATLLFMALALTACDSDKQVEPVGTGPVPSTRGAERVPQSKLSYSSDLYFFYRDQPIDIPAPELTDLPAENLRIQAYGLICDTRIEVKTGRIQGKACGRAQSEATISVFANSGELRADTEVRVRIIEPVPAFTVASSFEALVGVRSRNHIMNGLPAPHNCPRASS